MSTALPVTSGLYSLRGSTGPKTQGRVNLSLVPKIPPVDMLPDLVKVIHTLLALRVILTHLKAGLLTRRKSLVKVSLRANLVTRHRLYVVPNLGTLLTLLNRNVVMFLFRVILL